MTTRPTMRWWRGVSTALAVATTLAQGERAGALSCPAPVEETIALELTAVTVDGAPVATTPWRNVPVRLVALPDGRLALFADGVQGREEAYYVPAR